MTDLDLRTDLYQRARAAEDEIASAKAYQTVCQKGGVCAVRRGEKFLLVCEPLSTEAVRIVDLHGETYSFTLDRAAAVRLLGQLARLIFPEE